MRTHTPKGLRPSRAAIPSGRVRRPRCRPGPHHDCVADVLADGPAILLDERRHGLEVLAEQLDEHLRRVSRAQGRDLNPLGRGRNRRISVKFGAVESAGSGRCPPPLSLSEE